MYNIQCGERLATFKCLFLLNAHLPFDTFFSHNLLSDTCYITVICLLWNLWKNKVQKIK